MKLTLKLLGAMALTLGMALPAQALLLQPGDAIDSGNQTSEAQIQAYLETNYPNLGTELYKADVGDEDDPNTTYSGSFAASYTTTFFNDPLDPMDALIEHVAGQPSIQDPTYLLVKDGNQIPAWYLFDISMWDGLEDIELRGFWPNQGAISHVAIYGGDDPPGEEVPDGGSVVTLLGMALMGLAGARRMMA